MFALIQSVCGYGTRVPLVCCFCSFLNVEVWVLLTGAPASQVWRRSSVSVDNQQKGGSYCQDKRRDRSELLRFRTFSQCRLYIGAEAKSDWALVEVWTLWSPSSFVCFCMNHVMCSSFQLPSMAPPTPTQPSPAWTQTISLRASTSRGDSTMLRPSWLRPTALSITRTKSSGRSTWRRFPHQEASYWKTHQCNMRASSPVSSGTLRERLSPTR